MNKKVLTGIAVLALVPTLIWLWQTTVSSLVQRAFPKKYEPIQIDTRNFDGPAPDHFWPRTLMTGDRGAFDRVKTAIEAARLRGDFKVEDFEKLDFSFPDEKTNGDDPKYEVFNPKGPFKVKLYHGKIVDPEDLKQSTEPDSRVMFVRVRQRFGEDSGLAFREYIYGVVTHIKHEVCEDKSDYLTTMEYTYSNTSLDKALKEIKSGFVNLEEMGLPVVKSGTIGAPLSYCVKDAEGKWFYFSRIILMREQPKGDTKWRM